MVLVFIDYRATLILVPATVFCNICQQVGVLIPQPYLVPEHT